MGTKGCEQSTRAESSMLCATAGSALRCLARLHMMSERVLAQALTANRAITQQQGIWILMLQPVLCWQRVCTCMFVCPYVVAGCRCPCQMKVIHPVPSNARCLSALFWSSMQGGQDVWILPLLLSVACLGLDCECGDKKTASVVLV
jgi:hypothetical protein